MAFPFKKVNKRGYVNPDSLPVWRKAKSFFAKTFSKREISDSQINRLNIELLEPRVLLSADLSFASAGSTDLTLHFDQQSNEFQLLLLSENDQSGAVQSSIGAVSAMTDGILSIDGNGAISTLRLDVSTLDSLNIELFNSSNEDTLFVSGDTDFSLSDSILDVDGKTFDLQGFEKMTLVGGAGDNAFAIDSTSVMVTADGEDGNDTLL